MAKTATQKLSEGKKPKSVILESDFAGVKKGQKLFVATPRIVDNYIRKIPYGETRTIQRLRNELARRRRCDATCPVSTSIFIRISAQAAIVDLESGKSVDEITPFWRVLTSKDKITRKLSIDSHWVDMQRELEQSIESDSH